MDVRHPPEARAVAMRSRLLGYKIYREIYCPPGDILKEMKERNPNWKGIRDVLWEKDREIVSRIRAEGLDEIATEWEKSSFEIGVFDFPEQARIDETWLGESLGVLLWALGWQERILPYDVPADAMELAKERVNNLGAATPVLRDATVIGKARDNAETWHWRSRTRQLQEQNQVFEFPPGYTLEGVIAGAAKVVWDDGYAAQPIDGDFSVLGKPYRALSAEEWSVVRSITMERHRALNWLCGYAPGNDWDQTPTDT